MELHRQPSRRRPKLRGVRWKLTTFKSRWPSKMLKTCRPTFKLVVTRLRPLKVSMFPTPGIRVLSGCPWVRGKTSLSQPTSCQKATVLSVSICGPARMTAHPDDSLRNLRLRKETLDSYLKPSDRRNTKIKTTRIR